MTVDQLWAMVPAGWRYALEGTIAEAELAQLAKGLSEERRKILPAPEQWFRALAVTPPTAVRAVILGQDPYPNEGEAEGLAFSVPTGVWRAPPSLRRILAEAAREDTIVAGRTSLLPWAERGVLLLNTTLTAPEGEAGGHARIGWRPVTDAILRAVAKLPGPVVFMPWGAHARAAVRRADIVDGHPHILSPSVHPMERRGAFVGSNPFGSVNDRLRALRKDRMDWSLG